MKRRRTLYSFPTNPFLIWTKLAFTTCEMMLDSAFVIGHRTNRMARGGASPSVADQREFTLMSTEKISAAAESAQAMALSMLNMNLQLRALALKYMLTGAAATMAIGSSRTASQSAARQARLVGSTIANSALAARQISTSAARLAHDGLRPIHARARGNAKRLAKR